MGDRNSSDPFPIKVPTGDPILDPNSLGNVTIPFSRSARSPSSSRGAGYVQGKNVLTAYIDGSGVYGADYKTYNSMRSFVDGLFKITNASTGEFPDIIQMSGVGRSSNRTLFNFGQFLHNIVTSSTSVNILFRREHNRKARLIKLENPTLSDEVIFQNARKWVVACLQKITYEQYLPKLLGAPLSNYTGYNSSVDTGIDIFFLIVGYRFTLFNLDMDTQLQTVLFFVLMRIIFPLTKEIKRFEILTLILFLGSWKLD